MADIILAKPQAGERVVIPSAADARLQFEFPTGDAVLEKVGNDLVFTFNDGSSIVLTEFYTAYTKEKMPEFVVEGQTLAGADFFAALGSDNLMPAAGPAARPANGGRFRSYDEGSLMDGIDRLDGLDIGFESSAQPADFVRTGGLVGTDGAAGTDGTGGAGEPVVPPVNMGDLAGLTFGSVYEGALANGTGKHPDGTDLTADNTFTNLEGLPAGWTVVGGGDAYGKLVQGADGTWRYELTTSQGHSADGYDSAPGKVDVVLRDPYGREVTIEVDVDVVDDVPIVTGDSASANEGGVDASGNLLDNDNFGADGKAADGGLVSVTYKGTEYTPDASGNITVKGDYGTLVVGPDGSYTYTPDVDSGLASGATGKDEFGYTIKDADGDTSNGKLDVTVSGDTRVPTIANNSGATVDEAGLRSDTDADTSNVTTGSLHVGTNGESSTVTIGGVEFTLDKDGNLVGELPGPITTDRGTITITGVNGGKIEYKYELSQAQTHDKATGSDTEVKDTIDVTVKDATGDTATGSIDITIKDDVPSISPESEAFADIDDKDVSGSFDNFADGADGFDSITIDGATASRDADGNWSFDDPNHGTAGADGSLTFNTESGNSVKLDPNTGDYTVSTTDPDGLKDSVLDVTIKDTDGDIASGSIKVESPTVSTEQNGNSNDTIIKGEDSYTNDIVVSDTGGITTTIKGGDYNIAVVLDVSGSMSKSCGADVNGDTVHDSRLDMALESLKSLVASFEGHTGTINFAIFPFATYEEDPIYLTIKPGDDFDAIMKQFAEALNGIPRYAENDPFGTTNPEFGANEANKWLKEQNPDGKDVVYIMSDGDPSKLPPTDANNAFDAIKKDNAGVIINGIGYGEANSTGSGYLTAWGTEEAVYIKSPDDLTAALVGGIPSENRVGAGSDFVVGGAGQDIVFGDSAMEFGGKQGLEGIRLYIADKLGLSVDQITPELAYKYIKENPAEFDTSLSTGKNEAGEDIALDKADLLVGGSGHDIIYGQGGADILLGDGDVKSAELLAKELGTNFDSSSSGIADSITNISAAIKGMDQVDLANLAKWTETHLESKTDGNDKLFGGEGDDVLLGGGGNDMLFGGEGSDIILGGSGNDYIDGGAGADSIFGGSGNDLIVYDVNDIIIDGGEGLDILLGGSGDLDSMKDGLTKGTITDVEMLVSGKGSDALADLTNMDDLLGKLGIGKNEDGSWDMGSSGFTKVGDAFEGANGEQYFEMTNDDNMTIIVAKSALESSGA